jgi:4-amino-4-deoxy-L-arabinose transferase-like glycosyltransferase
LNDASPPHPLTRFAPWAAALAVAALLLARLSRFGIWDPSEIEVADQARRLAAGETVQIPHWGTWLVSRGFNLFGMHEWSGRLPIALGGVAVALLSYALTRLFSDKRAALYALIVAGTSPLLVLNARTMLGEAPTLALQAAIVLCGCLAMYGGPGLRRSGRIGWLVSCVGLSAIAVNARGGLLGPLPALVALTGLALIDRRAVSQPVVAAISFGTLMLCVKVAQHAFADGASFDPWLGGQPMGGDTPGFDAVFERVFHAFAPWSALLPLALAQLPKAPFGLEDEDARRERRLRVLVLLWLAASYMALSLFLSRYGRSAATMPVPALAAAVALFMREVERTKSAHWPAALGAALLASLLVRDYVLYPESPLQALPLAEFKLPEVFDASRAWIILLFGFGGVAVLALAADPTTPHAVDLRAPYRWLRQQWRREVPYKLWLIALAGLMVSLLVVGVVCWLELNRVSTIGRKAGRVLGLIPLALPLVVAAVPLLLRAADALGRFRWLPLLLAGFAVGGYTAFGFMPGLSEHFSPREVYETYNELARSDEPLVEYRVGARTAAYYAKGNAIEVETLPALLAELERDQRRWIAFPADEFSSIDRMFRERTGRHLFVADARSAKVMLATNQPIAGRKDANVISAFVRREPPSKIQHPVAANFEDRVQLLGYDLELPDGDHVGPGDHCFITWYFKVTKTIPGSYKIFVHIDESTNRIHGDHDPVDGRYPVRMWDVGDFIVDRQRVDIPASYPAGDYSIYLGFYSGDARLDVKSGPMDDGDRVRAGVLRIR